ncbi:phenylacetaldoxime dehydratase family protein [Bradyrhizobium sp. USDA 4486]
MESAIPEHLRTRRTRTRRIPDDYQPPVPAYVARFKPTVKRVIMAYFGIQFLGDPPASTQSALDWISAAFAAEDGAMHWDRACYVDEAGYTNIVSAGYWDDHARFDRWFAPARAEWTAERHFLQTPGRFIEVLSPSVEGYETLASSTDRPEGVAVLAGGISGEIQEHAYWGCQTPSGTAPFASRRTAPTIGIMISVEGCFRR